MGGGGGMREQALSRDMSGSARTQGKSISPCEDSQAVGQVDQGSYTVSTWEGFQDPAGNFSYAPGWTTNCPHSEQEIRLEISQGPSHSELGFLGALCYKAGSPSSNV